MATTKSKGQPWRRGHPPSPLTSHRADGRASYVSSDDAPLFPAARSACAGGGGGGLTMILKFYKLIFYFIRRLKFCEHCQTTRTRMTLF